MRNLAVGWGALMFGWAALGCGGVAAGGSRQEEETGPRDPSTEDEVALPMPRGVVEGGSSYGPRNPTTNGSTVSYGGTGGAGIGGSFIGQGGGGISTDQSCESPVMQTLSPFNEPIPGDEAPAERIAFASKQLVGDWHGSVTTPWVAPYAVVASFGADGGYSAHCEQSSDFREGDEGCCRAFYYGSDRDSALKQWSLNSVNADGSLEGEIDIAFCYEGEDCSLPGWQGEVHRLQLDETGNRLRFEFFTSEGHGPLQFDLQRD